MGYVLLTMLWIISPKQACAIAALRDSLIDVLHYAFHLQLDSASDEIKGEAQIRFVVRKANIASCRFDFDIANAVDSTGMQVDKIIYHHQSIAYTTGKAYIELHFPHPLPLLDTEEVIIRYHGRPSDGLIIGKNLFGDRTYFGDNWPTRAHDWLPVVDHPSDKATVDFFVQAPCYDQVIANGKLIERTNLLNGYTLTHWQESYPIPTKVMVIGVAPFAVQYLAEVNHVPVESWVYPQNKSEGFTDFGVAPAIIAYFDSLLGTFPYEKLANVQSTTRYGGMENASCIFYDEHIITGKQQNTLILAHEIGHQWFGDCVTETDWPHIWLSEGFATFMSEVFAEHAFGRDSLLHILTHDRRLILHYDSLHHTPVINYQAQKPEQLLNPDSYQKGAYVLQMLKDLIGDSLFWKGMRNYVQHYRHQNASTEDFIHIMEQVSHRSLDTFFHQWLYRPENPLIQWNWQYDVRQQKIVLFMQQLQNGEAFHLPLEIQVRDTTGQMHKYSVYLQQKQQTIALPCPFRPVKLLLDPEGKILMQQIVQTPDVKNEQ